MSAVVDSSVLVAALLDTGAHGIWAEQIIAAGSLHAPELVLAETVNIVRRLERTLQITAPEAAAAFEDVMQLEIQLLPFEPFAARIWELRHNVTSYDAWYVAAAEALSLPLATLDLRLTGAKGPTCEFVTYRER